MQILDGEYFRNSYRTSYWMITAQTEGITDAESLLQLPFRANCMNWVVGHLMVQREFVLELLNASPVWGEAEMSRYHTNSDPVQNAENAIPFHEIMQALAVSQQRLQTSLGVIPLTRWSKHVSSNGRNGTLSSLIAMSQTHENYHCGQLEILRQLAGKNDKII
jgi:hypothetical protein